MPIAAPVRKGLIAKRIAADRPDLSPAQIGRIVGTGASYIKVALQKPHLGRDKVKSVAS